MAKKIIIEALKTLDGGLFEHLHEEITAESLHRYLKPVSDTHAPFQSASWTRGAVIENLLREDGLLDRKNVRFIRNFRNTGNAVTLLGNDDSAKQIWLLAHLDTITYLLEDSRNGRCSLTPICYHLMEPGERPAVVMGYDLNQSNYQIVSRGKIVSENSEKIFFIPDGMEDLRPGMRVCFDSELEWDRESGEVRGSLDDAAGVVALIMATRFLANYDIELMLGLTDEEEGRAGIGNQTICRGGSRLLRYFDQPELVIASDIHEAAEMYGGGGPGGFRPGDGASFAEKSARGLGEIIPPHLYELNRLFSEELDSVGIRLRENNDGYVSRTEGINAMYRTPNLTLLGFLGINRHFQRDVESANINDLVDLAKVVVCYALLTKTSLWQEMGMVP